MTNAIQRLLSGPPSPGARGVHGRRGIRFTASVLMLVLLLAACGGEGEGGEEPEGEGTDPATETEPAETEEPAEAEEPAESEEPSEPAEGEAAADGGACPGVEGYPSENITWVVTQDPGGGSETDVRRMQPHLEQILGVPLEVQFRTGAGGSVGWSSLLDEEPDGYTIATHVVPQLAVQPEVFEDAGFNTEDFTIITNTVTAPSTFLVPVDSPYETLDDLVQAAEADPGSITFSAVGTLSGSAFAYGQFVEESGVELAYVPETGGAGGLETSLLGGHIDVAGLNVGHAQRIGTDTVRALAVAAEERHELLPDVPTFEEQGYDVTASVMWGVIGPPDMPEDITQCLSDAIQQVFEIEEFRDSLLQEGLLPVASDPAEAREMIVEQKEQLSQVLPLMQELEQG